MDLYCPECRHFYPAAGNACPTCGSPRCPWCGYCEECDRAFWDWTLLQGEQGALWRAEGCLLPEPYVES